MVTTVLGTSGNDDISIPLLGLEDEDGFLVRAGKGNDRVVGSAEDDVLRGGKGEDTLLGGFGDDTIIAGKHDDFVNGGDGADDISGNLGNDTLYGGKGADVIDGGAGDDFIFGVKGNNTLNGGAGRDTIDTGLNGSVVDGGSGQDHIMANATKGGWHTLTGGSQADTFEFYGMGAKKRSLVTITDFEIGLDDFVIAGVSDDDYMASLLAGEADATLTQSGDDLVLRLDRGLTLTFADTDMDDFVAEYSAPMIG
ncbi:Hemolysin-type calcium-binding repeat-containing protein [Litoreibacter ascidiaceicola]|uniref:Hemolysin-type calcium-binding repeat-containing protein n=1 Tax=Litoreibacter ascidiaceicola TaxID=1486859 RepID=A0A1M5AJI2_9RHOB|nr:calcium-binding protein [Litoreibacter ascidiaceicola]SHF30284.1 Hemolysin-type calcium-binding repeat-containing protein [Litoreibacter ascidiaceicola]